MNRLVSTEDALGKVTTYTYDVYGRPKTVKAPDNGVATFEYNVDGSVKAVVDPTGARAEATYDYLGRKATSTQLVRRSGAPTDAYTTTYRYDNPAGWPTSVVSPESGRGSVTLTYNNVGEVIKSTDAANNATRYQYDFAGRHEKTFLPDDSAKRTAFDAAGRPVGQEELSPSGVLLRSSWVSRDGNGNVLSTLDARGTVATFTYDAINRVTQATQPISTTDSIVTSFGYDANGNRTRFTDGRGGVFKSTFNTWGLIESETDPGNATFTNVYDSLGRVAEQQSPGGVKLNYTYDVMDRPTLITGTGAEVATADRTFGYDAAGRVTSLSGGGGSNTLTYDDRGLLTSVTGPVGNSSYTWTADALPASRTDAAGTTTYQWDAAGRLKAAGNTTAGLQLDYAYNNMSQVSQITYGGTGNRRVFGYDELHRVKTDELRTSGGTPIGKISYGWDANSNLTSKSTTGFAGGGSNTYTYDLANRLTSWNNGSTAVAYAFDKSGNRTQAGGKTFSYDNANRLISDSSGTTYQYTARGTLRGTTTGTVTLNTECDAFGQVTTQDSAPGTSSTYTYDALGRAIQPGVAYTGVGNDLAKDGSATYVRGPGGELLGAKAGSSSTYAWTDLHTDVVAQFTATGTTLIGSRTFDPWGKSVATAGIVGNLGYQSEWTDPQTQRVNMHARWYNPETGAFDSRDTVDVTNRFNYTDGNPLTHTDPSGHMRANEGDWYIPPPPVLPVKCDGFSPGARSASCPDEPKLELKPTRDTDRKCGIGKSSSADCLEQYIDNARKGDCPHASNENQTIMLSGTCTEVNTAQGCVIDGKRFPDLDRYTCINMAIYLDDMARRYKDGDDPEVKQAIINKHAAEAYEAAAAQTVALQERVAEAKCQADGWCRNAGWVGSLVGTVAGFAAGALCMAVTAGAGSIGCAMLGGFVGGFVGSLTTGLMEGKSGSELWMGALVDGAIGAVFGAITFGLGAGFGALAKSAIGQAFGAGARGVASRVAASGLGRMVSSATATARTAVSRGATAVSNGARNVTTALENKLGRCGVALMGAVAADAAIGAAISGHSFDPQTPVLMADGSTKPIKDVALGEKVKATDPESGATTEEAVMQLHVNDDRDLAEVTVRDDDSGQTTVLQTTWHHPFWNATDDAWTDAKDLKPGTRLRDDEGKETQQVVAVRTWTGLQQMRDLTVANIHTYYVMAADTPVLVHNCGKGSAGGNDFVDSAGCTNVFLGVGQHSDDLAASIGGHTFNGPRWAGTNTASGRPLWMEGVGGVARNGNVRISFSLDGLFGTNGRTIAGSAEEAFSANYARGLPMVGDWRLGAAQGNGTAWELATVGRAVRLGNREWSSIDWYWQGQRVDLANPFG